LPIFIIHHGHGRFFAAVGWGWGWGWGRGRQVAKMAGISPPSNLQPTDRPQKLFMDHDNAAAIDT
jgi:hypothetical protein